MDWLGIVQRLKAISQTGRHFAKSEYDLQRFDEIEEIAAEIAANHTTLGKDEIVTLFQEDSGYATPKSDCRGAIFENDKILLVREVADGKWTLPGGWCDVGMTPTENVIREVWEETGYEVRVERLLAVWDRDKQGHRPPYPYNIYKFFFLCEIIGGKATVSNETSEITFFGEDEIPELSRSRVVEHEIKQLFEYHRNPQMQTHCD